MKTLILCRHAKSDWPEDVADFDRPLKERGKRDAAYLGKLLAAQELQVDLMLSSPANRAISTAKIVAEHLAYESEVQLDEDIYYEGAGQLLQIIQTLPAEANTVMVFGHNPTMENFIRFLLQMQSAFHLPTCGMLSIELNIHSWAYVANSPASLRWMLIPRLKRKI